MQIEDGEKIISEVNAPKDFLTGAEWFRMVRIDGEGNTLMGDFVSLRGEDKRGELANLVRLISPGEMHGTGVLIKRNQYGREAIYFHAPGMEEVTEISGEERMEPFLGSTWAFEDFLSEDREAFEYEREAIQYLDEIACYRINVTPKFRSRNPTTRYSERRFWIAQDNRRPLVINYYDHEDELCRTVTFGAHQFVDIGGLHIPRPRRMMIVDHTRNLTETFVQLRAIHEVVIPETWLGLESLKGWNNERQEELISLFEDAPVLLGTN